MIPSDDHNDDDVMMMKMIVMMVMRMEMMILIDYEYDDTDMSDIYDDDIKENVNGDVDSYHP